MSKMAKTTIREDGVPSSDEKVENDSLSNSVVHLRRENEDTNHRPPDGTMCPENGVGIEGKGGKQALEKIRKGVVSAQKEPLKSKILCMVYTNEHGHDRLRAQFHTWARQCDGFIGASNLTDPSIGAIDLPHDGPESYGNMWQKVRSMWAYAHSNHYRDYDYFHIGGDDMYVVVENLRAYLDGPEVDRLKHGYVDAISKRYDQSKTWTARNPSKTGEERPLVFGVPLLHKSCPIPLGGPGYTLNRAALDLFAKKGFETHLFDATDPREDVFMGSFFCDQGVYLVHTQDPQGAWRYLQAGADRAYYFDGVSSIINPKQLEKKFGISTLGGMDGVSEQTIAMHLKEHLKFDKGRLHSMNSSMPELIYRYYALLQGWCD
jgi:hypothetical protein